MQITMQRVNKILGHLPSANGVGSIGASPCAFTDNVKEAPADAILGIKTLFLACKDPNKVNVSIGAYRTDEGKPLVLKCVQAAEQQIAARSDLNKVCVQYSHAPLLSFRTLHSPVRMFCHVLTSVLCWTTAGVPASSWRRRVLWTLSCYAAGWLCCHQRRPCLHCPIIVRNRRSSHWYFYSCRFHNHLLTLTPTPTPTPTPTYLAALQYHPQSTQHTTKSITPTPKQH